ncbi:MAG: hypothetical protein HY319_28335 [Armatimonadetes bacterium]|nr:hypothetical protein [Armatimonadota bacterium]
MDCAFATEAGKCRALSVPLCELVALVDEVPVGAPSPGRRVEVENPGLFRWAQGLGRPWTCRLGPLVPYLDDDLAVLEDRLETARQHGCDHVVAELARSAPELEGVAPEIRRKVRAALDEAGPSRDYRHRLFGLLRGLCDRLELTFTALDPEFQYLCNRTPCCRALGPP